MDATIKEEGWFGVEGMLSVRFEEASGSDGGTYSGLSLV